MNRPMGPGSTAESVRRWVDAGLIGPDQAEAIIAFESEDRRPRPAAKTAGRIPLVAEALGYLGGSLAAMGLLLLVVGYWDEMAIGARLLLAGAVAVASGVGGAAVPPDRDPALDRLQAFVWIASGAATALFVFLLASDVASLDEMALVATVAAAVAVHAGSLWAWRGHVIQFLSTAVAIPLAVGTAVGAGTTGGLGGLAACGVAAAYLAVALADREETAYDDLPSELLGVVGAGVAFVGSTVVMAAWLGAGGLFAVAVALGLVAGPEIPAVTARDRRPVRLACAGSGLLLLIVAAPATVGHYGSDAGVLTGMTTWALGAAVLGLGRVTPIRTPVGADLLGATVMLVGSAVTAMEVDGAGPIIGAATSVGLLVMGAAPGGLALSALGAVGLLVNVPWAIGHFFPDSASAPLLILVTGALIVVVAVILTRRSGRRGTDPAST